MGRWICMWESHDMLLSLNLLLVSTPISLHFHFLISFSSSDFWLEYFFFIYFLIFFFWVPFTTYSFSPSSTRKSPKQSKTLICNTKTNENQKLMLVTGESQKLEGRLPNNWLFEVENLYKFSTNTNPWGIIPAKLLLSIWICSNWVEIDRVSGI